MSATSSEKLAAVLDTMRSADPAAVAKRLMLAGHRVEREAVDAVLGLARSFNAAAAQLGVPRAAFVEALGIGERRGRERPRGKQLVKETRQILRAIERADGNVRAAARALGMAESTMRDRLRALRAVDSEASSPTAK